ncbi:hypothetical protein OEZ85_011866 [Tetradesmus obliquus]|uniref:PNPLA domain-containing protein n=1 Tax=Tetradesmus obliquus TaxID=3088 RepID=A0ABY8TRY8_TETOB|nr:hypothetical protein OEZ85_011866 [Tetradesmus obliquus]
MLSNLHCLTQQGMTAVLTADTPVAGTSAGGFVAAACRCSGGFASKADLVDRLLAGAHEPLISDGRCFARRRGKLLVDGGIRLPVAPIPRVAYSLIILAMPNQLQRRLWPYRLLMHPPGPAAIAISPGQYRAWPYSRNFKQSENLVMKPKPPEVLDMLFERGRRDALAWAQHVGLDALLPAPETQSPTAAEAVTADGMAGKGTKAAGVEGGGDAAVWQEMRSLLGMPPGELPLMLAVPAELQRML